MFKQPQMTPYRGGETQINHEDLNGFNSRLNRLENLNVQSPLSLIDNENGPSLFLEKEITEWQEVELVQDLPPRGAARAVLLLSDPENYEDIDWADISGSGILQPRSQSDPRAVGDEHGLVRGNRITYEMPVHDHFGVASWRGDRGLAYRSRRTKNGHWSFLNPFPGDYWKGDLNYTDTLAHKDFLYPGNPATDKQYVKYGEKDNTNQELFAIGDDLTVGGVSGHGRYVKIFRRGTYEVTATVHITRIGAVSGATFEARYNAASFLDFNLEYYCSSSWQTLDIQVGHVPLNTDRGSVTLHGKFVACSDAHGVRLVVAKGGTSGDLRLTWGNLHIQRVFYNHYDMQYQRTLGNDAVIAGSLPIAEGGYTEEFEDISNGDFDTEWLPSDGPDPAMYNGGYPTNANNPQWPNLPL